MSMVSHAHQPDLSTLIISQDNQGKYILQLNSSLSAFEGEIDYHYLKNSYKTPEEFQKLVIRYFEKNTLIVINDYKKLTFSNPMVLLGHETRLVAEVLGIPKNISSIYMKISFFKDIPRNQTVVILLKTGFPTQQYILNNENKQELHLVQNGGQWENVKQKKLNWTTQNFLIMISLFIFLVYLFLKFFKKKSSNT